MAVARKITTKRAPCNRVREPLALASPFGRLALSVCYDVRFPELYRALGEFDVMFVPSAFTVPTGAAHWETLLRARAIENQAYVVAPAQGGTHAGRAPHLGPHA